jgi:hypothetical protein
MKYFMSVCAIFKNEGHIIEEWIEHHLDEGFEHFYLANNESTDDYLSKIQKYIDNGIVTLFHVETMNCKGRHQIYSYNKLFLPLAKEETTWLGIIDLDEFLYACDFNKRVKDYLLNIKDQKVPAVYIPWTRFGSSGFDKQPKNVINNFLWRKKYINDSSSAKNIVKVCYVKKIDIHLAKMSNKKFCLDYNLKYNYKKWRGHGPRIPLDENDIIDMKIACNHYQIQSKEFFFSVKAVRGAADCIKHNNIRDLKYFKEYDNNDVFDDKLKKKKEYIRQNKNDNISNNNTTKD